MTSPINMRAAEYASSSLRELLRLIVEESDRSALREFHDHRTPFRYQDKARLRFIDCLNELRNAALRRSEGELAYEASDLTEDKFTRIPKPGENGIDCRNYFRAALNAFGQHAPDSELEADSLLARILQRLVCRHYKLSLLERQRNGRMTRYHWKHHNGTITILMPETLSGTERGTWLRQHVSDPDPDREGETPSVQNIINQTFGNGAAIPFEDNIAPAPPHADNMAFTSWADSLTVNGLAKTIASEKAEDIQEQRQAIQDLGPKQLKRLIHRIFCDLADGDYRDGDIARTFGLSKSTFSRFAGSQWNKRMPDLFANTARLMTEHEGYAECVRNLGLGRRVHKACVEVPIKVFQG